jgi:hypothetical protein
MGVIAVPITRPGHLVGMDKQGTYALPSTSTWHKIISWLPRPGFGFTSIVNDGLYIDGPGIKTITYRSQFNIGSGTQQFRAYVDGVPVGTASNNAVINTVPNYPFKGGEHLELWGYATNAIGDVVQGSSSTYIYLT